MNAWQLVSRSTWLPNPSEALTHQQLLPAAWHLIHAILDQHVVRCHATCPLEARRGIPLISSLH